MKFEEFVEAVEAVAGFLQQKFADRTEGELIFAQMTKLNEEVGELCNEVLARNGYQRKEKSSEHSTETLEGEFADVIITTLVLAKFMNIDVQKVVEEKFEIVKQRYSLS